MARKTITSPDMKSLDDIVQLVPAERKHIAEKLAGELAFMTETLDTLKRTVTEHGAVDVYENGKQSFMRESPALKAYNTTIQRYSLLYKQLADLLPKQTQEGAGGALLDFIQKG